MEQTVDLMEFKLERIYLVADILLTLLVDNPHAQELTEIIKETSSLLPEA